jgi:hypothetical protein
MWIFNEVGCGFAVLVVGTGFLLQWVASVVWGASKLIDTIVMMVASALAILLDAGYRAANHHEVGLERLLYPSTGGHIWFIPVWFLGLAGVAVAVNHLIQ